MSILFLSPLSKALAAGRKLAIPLDKAEKLKTVGGWAILKIQDARILFVRDTETTVAALSPVCTHEKCELAYDQKGNKLDCGCHHSGFDLKGHVMGGPARVDLATYPATLDLGKNRIIVEM
ncbi:MAG: Rieske (2Fe-2S) protein [Myxococcota bacterium]